MGMSSSDAPPPPPDPAATANAQAKANKETAITSYQLDATNQFTPYGSLVYTQDGWWDPKKTVPKFVATTTLSPQEQHKQEQQWEFDDIVNALGINQARRLSGHLDQPVQIGNEAT